MIKFLKLTEVLGNSATQDLLLNPAHIASIKISSKGVDTHICMSGANIKYYFVRESVEQIWEMLNDDGEGKPQPMVIDLRERYVK